MPKAIPLDQLEALVTLLEPTRVQLYEFVAGEPGTYLYESGTTPEKQVHMGLYGVLVVRPTMGANFAYNDEATEFDPDREYLIALHEIDPDLHRAVERNRPFNAPIRHDRYWTVNGRSFPDSIQDNFVPWLPAQPYGAMVVVEPHTATSNPLPALIRYANAGSVNHPFHPHGNHLQIIARDGRLLRGRAGEDASLQSFTTMVAAGGTYDLLARWVNLEGWSSSGPRIPIVVPNLQNLVFVDDLTFYSGSPYLGEQDELPIGVTTFNECGEFYFPWHSHALNEFQNFDEGFGGMATLWRVEPSDGC
jgi:FtsP/CotA-like multicopper oxidase with cupredoxin domain